MVILENRQRQRAVVTAARRAGEASGPLHEAPAVVLATRAGGRLEVHLLTGALADVGDEEIPPQPVEAEPPRVAETVRPDLGPRARRAPEGVGRRDRVGSGAVHVDAADLAEELTEILGAVAGIAPAASVAHADIEEAVRPEGELPAVVVGEGLRNGQEDLRRGGGGCGRIGGHGGPGDGRGSPGGL